MKLEERWRIYDNSRWLRTLQPVIIAQGRTNLWLAICSHSLEASRFASLFVPSMSYFLFAVFGTGFISRESLVIILHHS
jgi:hypothetical protein